jgi:hypothetical protein
MAKPKNENSLAPQLKYFYDPLTCSSISVTGRFFYTAVI